MANQTITLSVQGMHCSSCVKRVERALQAVPGVQSVRVDLAREQARVELTEGVAGTALIEAVNAIGFRAQSN